MIFLVNSCTFQFPHFAKMTAHQDDSTPRRQHTLLMLLKTTKYVQIPKLLVTLVPLVSTQLVLLSHHPVFLYVPYLKLQVSFIPFSKIALQVHPTINISVIHFRFSPTFHFHYFCFIGFRRNNNKVNKST
jgi:hypothetical protein